MQVCLVARARGLLTIQVGILLDRSAPFTHRPRRAAMLTQTMKSPSHLSRTLLIGALVASFGGWSSFPTSFSSACSLLGSESVIAKQCCCGADCHCGPTCGAPSTPSNGKPQAPASDHQGGNRDLFKLSVGFTCLVVVDLPARHVAEVNVLCRGDADWLQTLVAKHTCLQV